MYYEALFYSRMLLSRRFTCLRGRHWVALTTGNMHLKLLVCTTCFYCSWWLWSWGETIVQRIDSRVIFDFTTDSLWLWKSLCEEAGDNNWLPYGSVGTDWPPSLTLPVGSVIGPGPECQISHQPTCCIVPVFPASHAGLCHLAHRTWNLVTEE